MVHSGNELHLQRSEGICVTTGKQRSDLDITVSKEREDLQEGGTTMSTESARNQLKDDLRFGLVLSG